MTDLAKTTIIPTDDPTPILRKPDIKMVVLINDKTTAENADNAAYDSITDGVDYLVLWFKNPNLDEIHKMIDGLPRDLNDVVYFTLSTNNTVVTIVRKGDAYDEMTFREHFVEAGLPEHNKLP